MVVFDTDTDADAALVYLRPTSNIGPAKSHEISGVISRPEPHWEISDGK
jgi:hypothetical protein